MFFISLVLAADGLSQPVEVFAEPSAAAGAAHAPRPTSNPATWVLQTDYPAQSMRRGEQGATGFSLSVNRLGEITECRIVSSSGHPMLDQATCYLVTQRARFQPARDARGKPVEGSYNQRVRWVLPRVPGPTPGEIVTILSVDEAGNMTCAAGGVSGAPASLPEVVGAACGPGRQVIPYRDAEGKPVGKRFRIRFQIEEVPVDE